MKNRSTQEIPNGRWKKSQHDRFMKGLEKFGRDWVKIQQFVKSRSVAQVRSHAQKCFKNMTNQDIEAYIGEENDYTCQNFGRIKMNRKKIFECQEDIMRHEIQSKAPNKNSEASNLLEIFKRALQSEESFEGDKKIGKNSQKILSNLGNSGDLSTQIKRPRSIHGQETSVSRKNPFSDKIFPGEDSEVVKFENI